MKKVLLLIASGVIVLMMPFLMSTSVQATTSLYDSMIELGNDHTVALTKEGVLYTFGRNLYGQLGIISDDNQSTPVDLTSSFALAQDDKIVDIAAGGAHTGIVTSLGRVFTWGANGDGQLGLGVYEDKTTPQEITDNFVLNDGEIIEQLEMGEAFTAAITSEGRVFIWGSSESNQLGDTIYPYGVNTPIDLTPSLGLHQDETIIDIKLGHSHVLAITSEYRILAWGDNDEGECGITASNNVPTPTDITSQFGFTGDEHVLFVSLGHAVSYVVSNLGTVFAFGNNADYELGDGTTTIPTSPINVTSQFSLTTNETVLAISSGTYFSTLVTSQGRLFVWGQNWYEALGTGTSSTQENPFEITNRVTLGDGEKVVYTQSSKYFSAIITSTGDVHMWGRGDKGQLGLGNTFNMDIPTFNGLNLSEPDTTPPTCDETPTQTIEAGQYTDIDWATYITGAVDEAGSVSVVESDDPVLYDTIGTYTVSVDLTDTSDNLYTETFDVHVVDTTDPIFDLIPDQIIEIDCDPIDWTAYIINPHDNATGVLTPQLVVDNVLYDTAGTYTVTVKLVDASLNETSQTFNVEVVVGTPHPQYRTIIQEPTDPDHYYEVLNAVEVAVGYGHTIVLTAAGDVFSWGFNESGQLGDGTQTDSLNPINITENFNLDSNDFIIHIDADGQQSMALSKNGKLFVWGANDNKLYGSDVNIKIPYDASYLLDLQEDETILKWQISWDYFSVLTSTNRLILYGWYGDYNSNIITESEEFTGNIIDVSSDKGSGIFLTDVGEVYTWGWNGLSQLGNQSTDSWSDGFVNITNEFDLHTDETIVSVFMARYSGAVITSENRILHWGMDDPDGVDSGDGRYETAQILDITPDFDFVSGETIVDIIAGTYSVIFVTSRGRIFSMCDYIYDGGERMSDRNYVIDQTPILNSYQYKVIDFDMDEFNWAWVFEDGSVHTYGDNTYGQLGIEEETYAVVDVDFTYNEFYIDPLPYWDFVKVSTSGNHTLALTSLGELFAWGDNTYGQLATGDTISTSTLTNVTGNLNLAEGEKVIDVYAGVGYSFIITTEHRILAVGQNDRGQLGISNFVNQTTVMDITNRFTFYPTEYVSKISLYGGHNLLLTTEGRLFSWGSNDSGQVGVGNLTNIPTPQDITSRMKSVQDEYIIDIAAGTYHSLAITSLDRVFAWGKNSSGQIGNGTVTDYYTVPTNITSFFQLDTGDKIVQVAAGAWHSYALSENGLLFSWGKNEYGQLGNASTSNQSSPAPINSRFTLDEGDAIHQIYAGANTGFFITELGTIYAWGDNYYQEFGYTTSTEFEDTPVNITSVILAVTGDVPIIDMAVKGLTSFYLSEEHRLYSTGYNFYGQLGIDFTSYHEPLHEIHYDLTGDLQIWYIDVKPETMIDDETIPLQIYPTENCGIYIDSIVINGESYTDFTVTNGVIEISFDNTYNIGDYIEFNVTGGTMFNGQTFKFIQNTYTATTIIEDNIPPEFTLEDQIINIDDIGIDFTDWTIYAEHIYDNGGGEVTITIVSSDIQNKIPGVYTLTLQAEDEKGNTVQKSCEITLIDTVNPTFDAPDSITIDADDLLASAGDEPATTLVIHYNRPDGQYEGWNVWLWGYQCVNGDPKCGEGFEFNGTDDFGVILTLDLASTYSDLDTYDSIGFLIRLSDEHDAWIEKDYEQDRYIDMSVTNIYGEVHIYVNSGVAEVGTTQHLYNIDWTTYMTNVADNSDGDVELYIREDSVDYFNSGTYDVIVGARDQAGNETEQIIEVTIVTVNNTNNCILLPGIDTIMQGEEWIDAGVQTDQGSILSVSGTVDETTPGEYRIVYIITNQLQQNFTLIRYVNVIASDPVVVFYLSNAKTTYEVGMTYVAGSCTATVDGVSVSCIELSNNVNTSVSGVYEVVYVVLANNEQYTRTQYVFVYQTGITLTLYYRKEEGVWFR